MKESITKKHTDMSSLQKIWMRVCVLVVMATQVTLGVSQNLTVDGYSTAKVCPGEPIVLQATSMGSGVTVVDVYRSYNGQDGWMQIGSVNDPTGVFKYVVDMGNQAVWFKIREQNPDKTQSQLNETNAVKVDVETQCARLCHQSSSGDYINGTDFNVLPLNTTSPVNYKPAENANIESYFSDYDVRFQINQCSNGRAITNDVESYLGYLPKANESQYSNYYWVSNDNYSELNCAPFTFWFHMIDANRNPIWDEKYYRLAMKAYFVKQKGCSDCRSAQFKLETGVGSQDNFYQNADHMEIVVYDDATNQQLGQPFVINKSFGEINVGSLLCNDSYANKLLRLEIHFYGKFSLRNKNANTWVDLSPRFQQMGCMKVAIDYVSA